MAQENWFEYVFTCENTSLEGAVVDALNALLVPVKDAAKNMARARQEAQERRKKAGGGKPAEVIHKNAMKAELDSRVAALEALLSTGTAELPRVVDAFVELKRWGTSQQTALEELEDAADPAAEALATAFNTHWDALQELADSHSYRPPWQLKYKLLMTATEDAAEFQGGKVTLPDGSRINEARCRLCGIVLQHWAEGEGLPRYHNIDQSAVCDHHESCHNCFVTAVSLFPDQVGRDAMRELEEHLDDTWILETNVTNFLRFPVIDAMDVAHGLDAALQMFSLRPCLSKPTGFDGKPYSEYFSYKEVREMSLRLASGLRRLVGLPAGSFVGICLPNCVEWVLSDFACVLNEFVSVGLMSTWPLEDLVTILNNSGVSCAVCSDTMVPVFVDICATGSCPALVHLVVVDATRTEKEVRGQVTLWGFEYVIKSADHANDYASWSGVSLATKVKTDWQEAETMKNVLEEPKKQEERSRRTDLDIISLIYSSGSTGIPKGVIETEQRWRLTLSRTVMLSPIVVLSYAPLAHGMDRGMIWTAVSNGGRVGFARRLAGDPLEDAAVLRPTLVVAMPHVWTQMYSDYKRDLAEALPPNHGLSDEQTIEKTAKVLSKYKQKLGGRALHVTTGGAAISAAVLEWMAECFGCPVVDNYGTTEVPGISQDGVVSPDIELRITPLDSTENDGVQRGEICVRSTAMTPGYYRLPEATAAAFDADGFFHTGDIGELDSDGKLRILDRKGNAVELYRSGRSVWLEAARVEAILSLCELVHQVYIHGDRTESHCLAVVVLKDDCPIEEPTLLAALQTVGQTSGLAVHELPAAVIVEPRSQAFTVENGLLVGVGKPARTRLRARYQQRCEELYATLGQC